MRLAAVVLALTAAAPCSAFAVSGEEAVAEAFTRCLSGVEGGQMIADRVTQGLVATQDQHWRVPSDSGEVTLSVSDARCAVQARGVDGAASWTKTSAAMAAAPFAAGDDPMMKALLADAPMLMAQMSHDTRPPAAVQIWAYKNGGAKWSIDWVEFAKPAANYVVSGSVFLNDAAVAMRKSR